jgi:tripartite-type tricarboxylate transporter receptor subunit TctC
MPFVLHGSPAYRERRSHAEDAMPQQHGPLKRIAFSGCVMLALVPAAAAGTETFAGKQIRIVAPGGPSGGYALYAHLAAQHLGRFIPGHPNLVVSHTSGASIIAMNYLYEAAPQDGTVIAVMQQDLATYHARQVAGVRFDATRFNYIGRVSANVPVHMVWHSAPAQSIDDIKRREIVTAAVGSVGTHSDLPRALNALIGTKWKIITGYRGNNETRIAMERGEVQAAIGAATLFNEQLRPWREQGKVKVIVQYADFRHPTFPDVPTVMELAASQEAKDVFKFLVSQSTVGRGYGTPPGVPAGTLAILRQAFTAMVNDAAFKADAEKRGADLLPMSGEELAAYVADIVRTPPDIVRKTNEVTAAR